MQFTKREILSIVIVLIIGLLSLGAWQVFFSVIMTPGVSDVWRPVLWFSGLTAFFFLGTVVWTNLFFRIVGATLVFLPGLLFIHSWEYIATSILAILFIFWSSTAVARQAEGWIHFRFFKSARVGQFLFVVGLSLALSSGYYVFLRSASWEDMVPRFRIGEETTNIIFKVAGVVNPSFATLSKSGTTVDEFLLSLEQNKVKQGVEKQANEQDMINAFPQFGQYTKEQQAALLSGLNQEKIAQKIFLESGREQIATLVGRPVAGNEKISDALSLALQNKLITVLGGSKATNHIPSQAVPFFLSLLLFLTLLSFASILAPLCILGAELFFMLFLWFGWLKIKTVSVEQEQLEG